MYSHCRLHGPVLAQTYSTLFHMLWNSGCSKTSKYRCQHRSSSGCAYQVLHKPISTFRGLKLKNTIYSAILIHFKFQFQKYKQLHLQHVIYQMGQKLDHFYRAACNADAVLWWEFCLSVCLSVCHTRGLWQNGRKIFQIYIPYERTFSLVFWEEEWLVGGDPFYLKFWVNRPPCERNRRISTNNRS